MNLELKSHKPAEASKPGWHYHKFKKLIGRQKPFFAWYFLVVTLLIAWSYIEGVGNIEGRITIINKGHQTSDMYFKAGYFSTLNYGLYYIFILPLFLKAVMDTYKIAFQISEATFDPSTDDMLVHNAIKRYSSKVIEFLKFRYAFPLFILLIIIFALQNYATEKRKMPGNQPVASQASNQGPQLKPPVSAIPTLGWVQGLALHKAWEQSGRTQLKGVGKNFYIKSDLGPNEFLNSVDTVIVSGLNFNSKRIPSDIEFNVFVVFAKLFYVLFEAVVFFYNLNMLYCLVKFISQPNKDLLKSQLFIKYLENLVTSISISGFFLTIFVYFRYIANLQKGSFTPFNWGRFWANDQYTFLFGMLFIPITSLILFLYVYVSEKEVDIKATSLKRVISLYIPTIAFLTIFFIYLLQYDPYMKGQLGFLIKPLKHVNEYLAD